MSSASNATNSINPTLSFSTSRGLQIDYGDLSKKIIEFIDSGLRSHPPVLSIPRLSSQEIGKIVQGVRDNDYLRRKVELLDVLPSPTLAIVTEILKLGNITTLHLDWNDEAIEDDAMVALAEHPSLTSIHFGPNSIGKKGMRALTQNDRIRKLNFHKNNLGESEVILLAQMKRLEVLNLRLNPNIGKGAIALAGSRTLTDLDLSWCQLGDEEASALAKDPILQRLKIEGTFDLKNRFSPKVAVAFARSQSLFCLNYTYNPVSEEALLAFGGNRTLISLNISNCSLQDKDAITLSYSLAHNQGSLESLDMSQNHLTDNGAIALSQCSLKELQLEGNNIGDQGAIALADNKRLVSLGLSWNKIGKEGAKALATNKNLTELYLMRNPICDGISAFLNNRALTSFYWSFESENNKKETNPKHADARERIERIVFNNRTRVLNWMGVAVILASSRANATSPIRDSILPLAKEIQALAKQPEFWE